MLIELDKGERLTWPGGRHTPRVDGRGVYPRPVRGHLPLWIAAGGTPNSVVRAARLNQPLILAIIGGEPGRFAPLFDVYRQATAARPDHDRARMKTGISVHGFVAGTREEAIGTFYLPQAEVMNRIGRERGFPPMTRAHFDQMCGPTGAIFLGSPAEVTDKILAHHEIFGGLDRFLLQMAIGVIEHARLMQAIELFGTRVAPEVRRALATGAAGPAQ